MNSPQPTGAAPGPASHVWRFGDCELDEAGRVLRVRGTPVEIEAKPLEVLRTLLLHAGEVVTKAELFDSVWPGVAVVDGSLTTVLSKVRKLPGNDDRPIVTIPRIGYKVSAPVHCKVGRTPSEPVLDLAPGQPVPRREQWHLTRPALEAELEKASAERKARLEARIEDTRHKLQDKRDELKARIESVKREGEAKIESLQQQLKTARDERKPRLEKRLAEIRAEYRERSDKLHQAWELTKSALR